MLIQKDGKWVFISRKTRRPLAYYRGEGKPSEEWVRKQEQRVQYFKHIGEDVFGLRSALSPFTHASNYKKAHETLKGVMKRKTDKRHDVSYYAAQIAQSHPGVEVKKLVKMYKEEQEFVSKAGAGEWGRPELTRKYIEDTPGQKVKRFKRYIKNI
jgi:uncharacterized protein with LGFP repeats